jgi:hypothetical protein
MTNEKKNIGNGQGASVVSSPGCRQVTGIRLKLFSVIDERAQRSGSALYQGNIHSIMPVCSGIFLPPILERPFLP